MRSLIIIVAAVAVYGVTWSCTGTMLVESSSADKSLLCDPDNLYYLGGTHISLWRLVGRVWFPILPGYLHIPTCSDFMPANTSERRLEEEDVNFTLTYRVDYTDDQDQAEALAVVMIRDKERNAILLEGYLSEELNVSVTVTVMGVTVAQEIRSAASKTSIIPCIFVALTAPAFFLGI